MSQERTYFPLTWNDGFKKVFCTPGNEKVALQLLNAVIDDRTITHIERMESHHQVNAESYSVFDFYCKTEDGERIIVEMQNAGGKVVFMNRALAYSAMAILDQAGKSWNYEYKKVYFVGLLNYTHFHNRKQAFTKVMLQTTDDHIVTNDNYLQIFVELPKFASGIQDITEDTPFVEQLAIVLMEMADCDEIPVNLTNPLLKRLFRAADTAIMDYNTKENYRTSILSEAEYEYLMDGARKEGREAGVAEGIKEGIKEGEVKAKTATAAKLKELGIEDAVIQKATGLSEKEISAL